MNRKWLIALASVAFCCIGCPGGVYLWSHAWIPSRHLAGVAEPKLNAVELHEIAPGALLVLDVYGKISRVESGQTKWTFKTDRIIWDTDVQGNSIAALSKAGKIFVLRASDGKVVRSFVAGKIDPNNLPYTVALSPDETLVATADSEHNLLEWDIRTGKYMLKRRFKDAWRGAVGAFSRNSGSVFFKAGINDADFTAFVVSSSDAQELRGCFQPIWLRDGGILSDRDDHWLVRYDSNLKEMWALDLGDRVWEFCPNQAQTQALVSMPGRGPWTGGRTALVDLATGRVIRDLNHPDQPMRRLAWVGNLKIVGGTNGDLLVYRDGSNPIASLDFSKEDVRQLLVTERDLYAIDEAGATYRWPIGEIEALTK